MMLQQEELSDFVIGSGETHSIREFCEIAFGCVDLDYRDYVVQDPKLYRPAEVDFLISDPRRAHAILQWEPSVTFKGLVDMMVEADIKQLSALHRETLER
jgi:GDPmannose 4,6-dehydratase